ncbi:hypothetical protein KQX54_020952 [Cotesia glomerata]|uniref:Uncharacterized protein n=1 Tax=Cotesia glomerata TaxID=32391 RepID=A0AAV7J951_COTGL|nr:hypothetical protein KQX54_020952 [Cotesia glomerata]
MVVMGLVAEKKSQGILDTRFKSVGSSPKTPPVISVGDDSVFLSPSVVNSPTMSSDTNARENSATSSKQDETSSAGNKPD